MVGVLAIGYIFVSALIVFNIEPDTFSTFFDAIYWATVSLTTVGYGDIYAVSFAGKIITMLSALMGIAGTHRGQKYWKHWIIMEYLMHRRLFIPKVPHANCRCAA